MCSLVCVGPRKGYRGTHAKHANLFILQHASRQRKVQQGELYHGVTFLLLIAFSERLGNPCVQHGQIVTNCTSTNASRQRTLS